MCVSSVSYVIFKNQFKEKTMKNQYRGSQNIISEKKVSLDKGVYRGASHNGFKVEKLNSDQNHKKMYRGQVH